MPAPTQKEIEEYLEKLRNLPGNGPDYDFTELTPAEDSPLKGKSLCVLGSSVAFGAASMELAVGEYLAARLGMTLTKETVSGTTLTDTGDDSYVSRMKANLDPDARFDLFLCQLSTNDATKGLPLGEVSPGRDPAGFDPGTVTGAMETIIAYAREHWRCPVAFFTGSRYDSPEYAAMVRRLEMLAEKWDLIVLDLWNGDGFNDIPQEKRELCMADPIHPTRAGYRDWWGPELEKQLVAAWNARQNRKEGN